MTENEKNISLWNLFWTFAKVGVMTFGGGYAMLPILQKEVVEKKKWCTEDDLTDYFAIGQCTPGIIAVNTATFIGYKKRKNLGGIIATLGVVFPSYLIISSLASVLQIFDSNQYVQMALAGIRVAVCALIFFSVIKLAKKSIVDVPTVLICLTTIGLMIAFSPTPIIFILCGILLGVIISLCKVKRGVTK